MSKSKTRKTAIILCISIILMLVSAVATMVIQTGGGSITIKELHWETDGGFAMDGWLFIPDGATAENPAPGIVTSHGMYNNKGMQDANFVELARRGYVVLAQDMPSHGESDNVNNVGLVTSGLYQSVKVLADLPYVDKSRIGITGHSMGGMSCNAAIELDNQAEEQLISAVLLNCADATYVDADGAWTNIYGSRDAGIMAAQYDEFFMQDTDENGNTTLPKDYVQYNNAQSFLYFGTDPTGQELRQADTVYYETIDGREAVRVIYNPAITHPWAHFSQRATSAVISFFEETLGAPNPLPADDQIWQVKEAFNLVGLIGFGMFITCFTLLMVKTPFFASLGREEPVAPRAVSGKGKAWFWGSLLLGAIFGSAVYIPIMLNAKTFTVFYDGWPQSSPWGVCLWAAACGLLLLAIGPLRERDWKRYFWLVFLAVMFHVSALLMVPLWFLKGERINRGVWTAIIPLGYALSLAGIYATSLISFIPIEMIQSKFLAYDVETTDDGGASIFGIFQMTRVVLFLLLVLLMAVVPEITFLCAALLGFSSPSNFVFLAVIGLLILKVFSNSVEISVLRHKVEELSQEVALFHKDEIDGAEKHGR